MYRNMSLVPRHILIIVTTATHIRHTLDTCTHTRSSPTSIDRLTSTHTHFIPTDTQIWRGREGKRE